MHDLIPKLFKKKWERFKQTNHNSWRKVNLMNSKRTAISKEDRILLVDYYKKDIEFIEAMLDRQLDWHE